MRDPKRIRPMLEVIANVWEKNPDWRLGQLLCNAWGHHRDMFFPEDDELLDSIKAMDREMTVLNKKAVKKRMDVV